jgi:hypothetical protein
VKNEGHKSFQSSGWKNKMKWLRTGWPPFSFEFLATVKDATFLVFFGREISSFPPKIETFHKKFKEKGKNR